MSETGHPSPIPEDVFKALRFLDGEEAPDGQGYASQYDWDRGEQVRILRDYIIALHAAAGQLREECLLRRPECDALRAALRALPRWDHDSYLNATGEHYRDEWIMVSDLRAIIGDKQMSNKADDWTPRDWGRKDAAEKIPANKAEAVERDLEQVSYDLQMQARILDGCLNDIRALAQAAGMGYRTLNEEPK
jgi:hypothetical protein